MFRPVFSLPFLAMVMVIVIGLPGSGSLTGAAPAAGLLQCMESCIKHEGGKSATNKATCKSRCANIPSSNRGQGAGNCMDAFKDCKVNCGKDRKCARVCKKSLMSCK